MVQMKHMDDKYDVCLATVTILSPLRKKSPVQKLQLPDVDEQEPKEIPKANTTKRY